MLTQGEKIPPVRQLATDLGLANGTVARAYQELETAGLVVAKRAAGTRVAPAAGLSPRKRAEAVAARAREYVLAGRRLGADDTALADALAVALKEDAGATSTFQDQ